MAVDVDVSVSVNDVESGHCVVGHGTPSSLSGHHPHHRHLADDCTGCGTGGGIGDDVGDGEACGEWSWEQSGPYCLCVCVCVCVVIM